MHFPLGAFIDPAAHQLDLFLVERSIEKWRRHPLGLVGCANPLVKFATRRLSWRQNLVAASIGEHALFGVEPQISHALFFIGTMAGKTVVGENGADLAIEIDRFCGRFSGRCECGPQHHQRYGADDYMGENDAVHYLLIIERGEVRPRR